MNIYLRGLVGGLAATLVLSILMVIKARMGMMPGLDVIGMLAGMVHAYLGINAGPATGWLLHFLIGTVLWGLMYSVLFARLPGEGPVVKAVIFAVAAWVLMMILPMPMGGAGMFGLKLGIMAPVMTLMLHVIWGVVLGLSFRALSPRSAVAA